MFFEKHTRPLLATNFKCFVNIQHNPTLKESFSECAWKCVGVGVETRKICFIFSNEINEYIKGTQRNMSIC